MSKRRNERITSIRLRGDGKRAKNVTQSVEGDDANDFGTARVSLLL